MATGRVPTTANSPLTAKGDLFGYSTTQARVPVGNNGETLVADSSTSTGLRWTPQFLAGKNKIINGDFGIWQRGTSFTPSATNTYTADRWFVNRNGTGATVTVTRETFSPGSAPQSGYEGSFFLRYNHSVAGTGGTFNVIAQYIEDVRTVNGTINVSFWAKSDSSRSMTLQVRQFFGSGGSAETDKFSAAQTITNTWQRFSIPITLDSLSGKTIGSNSYVAIFFTLAANTAQTIDLWGVQVEQGSVATPFSTATGTLAGELAACQRYYWRSTPGGTYSSYAAGSASSTTAAYFHCNFPVPMRVSPTSVDYSNLGAFDSFNGPVASTFVGVTYAGLVSATIQSSAASGLTQFRPYLLANNNNTAGYFGLSAEL